MIEVFILTDVKWFELQLPGFFLHLVVFVTKTSICFPCDPKPTCSCLSIAFHAHFGDVMRVHRELRLSCSLWQDWARIWEGFFVLLSLLAFSELPKEARDISCFLLPLAQTGLPLLMKWLFPMSRHQQGEFNQKQNSEGTWQDEAVLKLLQVKGVRSSPALQIYRPK